jgi:hypothetical protein
VTNRGPGNSLAHAKFIRRHEDELNSYWFHRVAAIYSSRWLQEHGADIKKLVTSYPGDNHTPFKNLALTPSDVLALVPKQEQVLAQGTVVRLVTIFENFLYDCIQRAVFLHPTAIAIEVKVDGSALASAVAGQGARAWFAHYVADKLCRGKTPTELLSRVDAILKAGVSSRLASDVDEWTRWTLVRNAIVHLGGDVTRELADRWPARFSGPGTAIKLLEADVRRVAYLSRTIAKNLDLGQQPRADRIADRDLLASELFIRFGVADPSELARKTTRILNTKMNRAAAEQLLAKVRRASPPDAGIVFPEEFLGGTT